MTAWYPLFLTVHLLCAVIFGGGVIFEVLILESLHKRLPARTMRAIEAGIVERAKRIMPWVVGLLYLSGLAMLHARFPGWTALIESNFGRLLLLKVALAGVVLACFVGALTALRLRKMTPRLFKRIHLIVFVCVLVIVVLAKAMFFF